MNRAELIKASRENLLAALFTRSRSVLYEQAVEIAKAGKIYSENESGGQLTHFAIYDRSREGAELARELINCIGSLKGAQVFAGGRMARSAWSVIRVLDCYLEACLSRDFRAHCNRVIDDPFRPGSETLSTTISFRLTAGDDDDKVKGIAALDRYTFPCSYLLQYGFRFDADHPSSPQDFIQAEGVRHGCDWCPNFDPDAFRKLGTRLSAEGMGSVFRSAEEQDRSGDG
jgi:hypothetical protein